MLNGAYRCGVLFTWLAVQCLFLRVSLSFTNGNIVVREVGDNVTFRGCNFTADTLFTVLTFNSHNTSSRIAYNTARGLAINEEYVRRTTLTDQGLLILSGVTYRDRGQYKCTSYTVDVQTQIVAELQLKVGVKPTIQPFPLLAMLEGDSRDIACNASGVPAPRVTWYRNGTLIGRDASSTIINVAMGDTDAYECHAENDMGNVRRSLKVIVHEKPMLLEFYHNGDFENGVFTCQNVSFHCEAQPNADSPPSFRFYHNGRLVRNKSWSGDYRVDNVQREHEGNYTCVPVSEYGVGISRTTWLSVIDAPDNCKNVVVRSPRPESKIPTRGTLDAYTDTPSRLQRSGGGKPYAGYYIACTMLIFIAQLSI